MAFYYVKSGGTATGDGGRYASAQTGSFAGLGTSGYYATIALAFGATTSPASGDHIYPSDAHSLTIGPTQTWTGPSSGEPVHIISVSDTAIDQSSVGASETINSGGDFVTGGYITVNGVDMTPDDDLGLNNVNAAFMYKNATLTSSGAADKITIPSDGQLLRFENVIWHHAATNNFIQIDGAARFEWIGGALTSTTTTTDLFTNGFQNGGGSIFVQGVDLSTITDYWIASAGASSPNDDTMLIKFIGCTQNASLTAFVEEAFASPNQVFEAYNCGTTSANAEYQFYKLDWLGSVEDQDDSGIHRDESTAFSGGTKVSKKVVTLANISSAQGFAFDLPARFAELSAASTDTIRIYFAVANTETLTDVNVWAELIYPDGTNSHVYNYLSNQNSDILAAGTTHTDDSGGSTWKDGGADLTGHNEYYMDLDTSGDAGADGVPTIRIHVGEPSITVYFDTTVDVVA